MKPYRLWLIVAVLGNTPAYTASDDTPVRDLIEQANQHYRTGHYELAADLYQQAATQVTTADVAIIQHNLGLAYYQQYDYPSAIKYFAQAINSTDAHTASRALYHLAHLRHQQALDFMLSFQDAMTPLLAALDHYRTSLRLNPEQADVRYNLEQAQRLWLELSQQNVLPQSNPETREQKTSDNQGQASDESADKQSNQNDLQQDQADQNKSQGGQARQAPQKQGSQTGAQTDSASEPQSLSPEQAEQLIEARRHAGTVNEGRAQYGDGECLGLKGAQRLFSQPL